ncbi:hypothetical protein TI04_01985 [Achromatium sp. WMS2]|nr:hypothetical protein TI04_01985 [Achromatium sp. WMS2]
MSTQPTAFEHPLNEKIRIFLRLEHLFQKMDYFLSKPEDWATRTAIDVLIDIISVVQVDIKGDVLKELERYTAVLEHVGQQSEVNAEALKQVLDDLKTATTEVRALDAQIIHNLRSNEFLKSITQRTRIPGGSCSFDLPHYTYWLHQPIAYRKLQIENWMHGLLPIRTSISLLLSLIRNSCDPKTVIASDGLYRGTLDAQLPVQMLRIQIDPDLALYPEVSGHKHKFNIRFLEFKDTSPPEPTKREVEFELTCCIF